MLVGVSCVLICLMGLRDACLAISSARASCLYLISVVWAGTLAIMVSAGLSCIAAVMLFTMLKFLIFSCFLVSHFRYF